jgi:hypothetical protein
MLLDCHSSEEERTGGSRIFLGLSFPQGQATGFERTFRVPWTPTPTSTVYDYVTKPCRSNIKKGLSNLEHCLTCTASFSFGHLERAFGLTVNLGTPG